MVKAYEETNMWELLNDNDKDNYRLLMTNFASLSEAFSQKASDEEAVAPIVNSKFQETAFQKAFNAVAEDIANTSFDVSINLSDGQKFLVGIKSFGITSGDQKIAQFKAISREDNWDSLINKAIANLRYIPSEDSDNDVDPKNYEEHYLALAQKIAEVRNDRIASSKALAKGFDGSADDIEMIYHVLMPTKKGTTPKIYVGETDYAPIDIENIKILDPMNKPQNFKFTDGIHVYKYTSADSQLLMAFNNREIVVDSWEVEYVDNAFKFFQNLHMYAFEEVDVQPTESVSWMIPNVNGKVEENSGYNAFDGGPKMSKQDNYRERRIKKIIQKFQGIIPITELNFIRQALEFILLSDHKSADEKAEIKKKRSELKDLVIYLGNDELKKDIFSIVYRPVSEMYIPIPNSKTFHLENPDFFGKSIGTFKGNSSKLALPKEERTFTLEFLPSGNQIEAYINQDNGKSIQSIANQGILGEWILREVFQLEEYEPLTVKRLNELGINAVRLSKYEKNPKVIYFEFIWIDENKPPKDAIGWVSNVNHEN